jgi:hypothetical protein
MNSRRMSMLAAGALVLGAAWLGAGLTPNLARGAPDPIFDDAFWKAWGDGQAEVSSYELTFPRYGAPRAGVAVAIFVTETFSDEARVKADPGVHAKSDEFPVMKLNLVQDFSTGIYDYNLMTSVFSALVPFHGRPAGSPAKVAFSSQEWCGMVYHQLLPGARDIRSTSHSYFDKEADRDARLDYPAGGVLEDALYPWARGFSGPRLAPGESIETKLLRSLELVRLKHEPEAWDPVTLSRAAAGAQVDVPAGMFEVDTYTATVGGPLPRTWTFLVESAAPHRLIRWETSEGRRADLVASERMRYWEMNGPSFDAELSRLGLAKRPPRTP